MALKIGCIFLASGHSKRFRENKLLAKVGEHMLVDTVFANHPSERFNQTVVVTRYAPVAVSAAQCGFTIVENQDVTDDISITIRLGLDALRYDMDGCMFSVCDQPMLTTESVRHLVDAFRSDPDKIAVLSYNGKRGNPVIFPKSLFEELKTLKSGQSGSAVIRQHEELLNFVGVQHRRELLDIDYRSDLLNLFEK